MAGSGRELILYRPPRAPAEARPPAERLPAPAGGARVALLEAARPPGAGPARPGGDRRRSGRLSDRLFRGLLVDLRA